LGGFFDFMKKFMLQFFFLNQNYLDFDSTHNQNQEMNFSVIGKKTRYKNLNSNFLILNHTLHNS